MIYGVFYNECSNITLVGLFTKSEFARRYIIGKVIEEERKKDEQCFANKKRCKEDLDFVQHQIKMVSTLDDCEEKENLLSYLKEKEKKALLYWNFVKDVVVEEKDYEYYSLNMEKYMRNYGYVICEFKENVEENIDIDDIFNGGALNV